MRILYAILLCLAPAAVRQAFVSFPHEDKLSEAKRAPIALQSPVQDKNFYLLSLLEAMPSVRQAIKNDTALRQIAEAKLAKLAGAATSCEADVACHTEALCLQEAEIQAAQQSLRELCLKNEAVRHLADVTMRESGMFQRYHAKPGAELLSQAWLDAARGVDNLIEVYAAGRAPRYPAIDAAAYDVKTESYRRLVNIAVSILDDQRDALELFFQPSLRFALALLEINRRDEAGRLEPLQLGENEAALLRMKSIRWNQYMKNHSRKLIYAISALLLAPSLCLSWGGRGHREINAAAIRALPAGELDFLRAQEPWIVYLSIIPDTYRTQNEPFLKIFEDPNHGWFIEQSAELMKDPPRSRYEFIISLYQNHLRTKDKLTNVRWTGTLPYAAVEHFERTQAAMRRLRAARKAAANDKDGNQERAGEIRFIEQEIATYIGFLGHYIGDGAMPLHDSIHHDGWQGENPKNFTREPSIHGRMESRFVDLIQVKAADFAPRIGNARVYGDPFAAIVKHLLDSATLTEKVYEIDLKDQWADPKNEEARNLAYKQLAAAAETLRNLIVTAWARSGEPPRFDPAKNPISPDNPKYNPATGSAPAN